MSTVSQLSYKSPAYRKRWTLDRSRGLTRMTDAGPCREHLAALAKAGVTLRAVAEQAAISPSVVARIRDGQRMVRNPIAARILAVSVTSIARRDRVHGFVLAVGARRRVQALMAIGWRHEDMKAWLRANGSAAHSNLILSQAGDMLERRTADAMAAMYDALWSTPGPSDRTRARARLLGYAPPLAWDDDTIDDPAARPLGVQNGMAARRAALIEDVEELVAQGETVDTAAARLGKNRQALQRSLERAGRNDLWARLQGRHVPLEASA